MLKEERKNSIGLYWIPAEERLDFFQSMLLCQNNQYEVAFIVEIRVTNLQVADSNMNVDFSWVSGGKLEGRGRKGLANKPFGQFI